MSSCERPFWEDPTGFLSRFDLQFDPSCESQIYNFVLRIMLLGFLVGLVGAALGGPLVLAVCILLAALVAFVIILTTPAKKREKELQIELTPSFTYSSQTGCGVGEEGFANKKKEGFTMRSMPTVSRIVGIEADLPYNDAAPYSGPSLPDSTPPTAKNLFMNVLLEEYKYNPDRPAAAPVTDPIVKQAFDDYFRTTVSRTRTGSTRYLGRPARRGVRTVPTRGRRAFSILGWANRVVGAFGIVSISVFSMDRIYNGQEGTHDTPSQESEEVDEEGDEEAEGGVLYSKKQILY